MIRNLVEFHQKLIISFLTVSLDEMTYGVRQIKKVQNPEPAFSLQDFFMNFANFTDIHRSRRLFLIRLQVNFDKIF